MVLCIPKIRVIIREKLRRARRRVMELWCLGILINIRATSVEVSLRERVRYSILKVNQNLLAILNKAHQNQAS